MQPLWVLGTMSGTSLDGVDAAMVRTNGVDILEFGETGYQPYSDEQRDILRAALGQWPGDPGVEAAAEVVETAHIRLLRRFKGADLIGFHGQTLAHDPRGRRTHQAGSGRILAEMLNCPVAWDFRTADVKLGGEGAPLAPVFHFACAKWIKADAPVVFLNLGGVGNVTWVDPRVARAEDPGAMLAFDTGPANAPIDDLMQMHFGEGCDVDGKQAASGQVDPSAVEAFLRQSYFLRMPPKSLDRNDFATAIKAIHELSPKDAIATLTEVAAACVAAGLQHCPIPPVRLLVTGGGRKNATLMARLAALCACDVAPVEDVGLDGDMLEAQAFAYLAARVKSGRATSFPSTTGVAAQVGGGQISRPDV